MKTALRSIVSLKALSGLVVLVVLFVAASAIALVKKYAPAPLASAHTNGESCEAGESVGQKENERVSLFVGCSGFLE